MVTDASIVPAPGLEDRARRVRKLVRIRTDALAEVELRNAAMHDELTAARALAAEHLGAALEARAELDAVVARLAALEAASAELAALKSTKLLRWSTGPRRAYGRCRSLVVRAPR